MFSSILTALGPLIAFLIKSFIQNKEKQQEMIKSYYAFLDANDKAIQEKVDNIVKLNQARREKQQQLLEEKRKRDLEAKK